MFDPALLQAEVIEEFADVAAYGLEADECMSILSVLQAEQANERKRQWWAKNRGKSKQASCKHCGEPIPAQEGRSRPRVWCSESCRKMHERSKSMSV